MELCPTFEDFVATYSKKAAAIHEKTVLLAWEMGAHIKAALDDTKYGDNTAENLADAFNCSVQTIRLWRKVFISYSEDQIKEFASNSVGIYTIQMLLRLNPVPQQEAHAQLLAGEIRTKDIEARLKEQIKKEDEEKAKAAALAAAAEKEEEKKAAAPEPTQKGKDDEAVQTIMKGIGPIEAIMEKLTDYATKKAIASLDSFDLIASTDKQEEMLAHLSVVFNNMMDTMDRLEEITQRVREVTNAGTGKNT
jgi:hypothetical protein